MAEDYTNHDPPFPGLPAGREGLKQTFAGFWSAFPDVQGTIEHLIADEDKVAILVSFRGTHRGDLMGIPPTEREVAIRFMDIFRVAGAQIAERWAVAGRAGLMRQLGAVAEGTSSDGAMTAG